MDYKLIVFGSQTTAIKISKEIDKLYKIKSEVIQTPKRIKLRSCTYCIKIKNNDYKTVINHIVKSNIYYIGIYDIKDVLQE